MSRWSPQILSVLRIITALLFMQHRLMKIFTFQHPIQKCLIRCR